MARRKLTEDEVRLVLELRAQKLTQASIAKILNVSTPNISFILTGRTWGHVTGIVFKPRNWKKVESPEPEPRPEPEPELEPEPLEAQPEPESEPEPPAPKPEPPKPEPRNPDKQYCEECDRVMSVKNTSSARYTVFVLWECNCGFEYLEKRHTGAIVRNPAPDFFEKRAGRDCEED